MKQNKHWFQRAVPVALYTLGGAACGYWVGEAMGMLAKNGVLIGGQMQAIGLLLAGLCAVVLLQVWIHEGGHLVFGLLTGYRFCSFRVFSRMLVKTPDGLRWKRFSLAGTAGQCLLSPPPLRDGKCPYVLYNLGGSLLNLAAAAAALAVVLLCPNGPLAGVLWRMFALMNLISAVTNGVPLQLGAVDNDGRNALSLGKDPAALRAFWVQLKVNEAQTRGARLRDMPTEWFAMPEPARMKNSMVAALGVLACNYGMDCHCFARTQTEIIQLLAAETAIAGLHRSLLLEDAIYCGVLARQPAAELNALRTQQDKAIMKAMKNYLSVLRTEYACALVVEQDAVKAEKLLHCFEKSAAEYPYAGDAAAERELVALAAEKCGKDPI